MECSCEEWGKSMAELAAISVFYSVHGLTYKGEPFDFCPWCGTKLVKDSEEVRDGHSDDRPDERDVEGD